MRLVAGLGNPGARYRGTRHNVGFEVMDLLARRHGLGFEAAPAEAMMARWRRADEDALLVKPLTFMNVSGDAVATLARYYKIETAGLLIVCDDVNLPLGRLRVRASGTEGGHNGLRSIADLLGTIEYPRLRVGVGRGDTQRELADHVLARFDADETAAIEAAVARAADAVETWLTAGLVKTMNVFNRAEEPAAGDLEPGAM